MLQLNNKCEKCGSGENYIRFKEEERVCRKCGHIQKINLDKLIAKKEVDKNVRQKTKTGRSS